MTFVYKAGQKSIVTLQLLPDSATNESRENIHNSDHAKFKVIKLVNPLTNESIDSDSSFFDSTFIYRKGEIVLSTQFDPNLNEVYGKGIHYFKTYKAALFFCIMNLPI